MHKNTKNVLTKALALTLAVSMMTVSAPAADAAKKPALSAKKVTLKAGKSKKITVKNVKAKKVKKLTVKTNKKKVATVKKNGKTAFTVKGVKAGTAKVTATVKVGKKNYKLNVKVKVTAASKKNDATAAPAATATTAPTATAAATAAPAATAPAVTTQPTVAPPIVTAPAIPEPSKEPVKTFPYTVIENNFDTEEDMKDWYIRYNEDDNTAAGLNTKISVSSEAHTGAGAMLVSERLKAWNSPTIDLTDKVVAGGNYKVSFWAKVPQADEDFEDGIKLRISGGTKAEEGADEIYCNYPADTDYEILSDEWIKCETTFNVSDAFYSYIFYIESNGSGKASFLIDDLKIECQSEPAEFDASLPSLKDTYKDYFPMMGTALSYETLLNKNSLGFVKKHYDSITYGNSMKPDSVMGSKKALAIDTGSVEAPEDSKIETASIEDYYIPDGYASHAGNLDKYGNVVVPKIDFASIDKQLKVAHDNGLKVRYHTFIWHQQMPHHFFTVGYSDDDKAAYVDQATMYDREEMFIKSVLNHIFAADYPYRDTVYTVDVVNEYIHMKNRSFEDGKDNWWRHIFGEEMKLDCEYVKRAFKYAYDALKANGKEKDVTLLYNDYNTYDAPAKVVTLINNINKKDDINPDGEKLCAGIGMQSHLGDKGATVEAYNNALDMFREAGFEIQVTELDVTKFGNVTEETSKEDKKEIEAESAEYWGQIMSTLLDQKAKGANITAVVIWGLTDATSWRSDGSPLLFGKDLADKKPAFDAVINAAKNFKASK